MVHVQCGDQFQTGLMKKECEECTYGLVPWQIKTIRFTLSSEGSHFLNRAEDVFLFMLLSDTSKYLTPENNLLFIEMLYKGKDMRM